MTVEMIFPAEEKRKKGMLENEVHFFQKKLRVAENGGTDDVVTTEHKHFVESVSAE